MFEKKPKENASPAVPEDAKELDIPKVEKIITEYETRAHEYKAWMRRHLDRGEEDKIDQVLQDLAGLGNETLPTLRHIFEEYKAKAEELERRKGKIDEVRRAALEGLLKGDD